jgi:hypothetical protein
VAAKDQERVSLGQYGVGKGKGKGKGNVLGEK